MFLSVARQKASHQNDYDYFGSANHLSNCRIKQHPIPAFDIKKPKTTSPFPEVTLREEPKKVQRLSKEELSELLVKLNRQMAKKTFS